jgi:hypothetical protein
MKRDDAQKPATLESLVGSTILSLAMLIYGGYGLYANKFLLPTRVGVQHMDQIDASVFYVVVVIAVPTNIVRLREWVKHGDGSSGRYQTADAISAGAVYGYIAFIIFRALGGGA